MRLMGLDVGSRTVGVAVSDPLGWTAQGLEIIRINEDKQQFGLKRLKELVTQYEVTAFVLGLPKNMNNSIGPRAEKSQAYGDLLKETFGLASASSINIREASTVVNRSSMKSTGSANDFAELSGCKRSLDQAITLAAAMRPCQN